MAGTILDIPVKVSADLVRKCPGLAFDIGGSVVKIVYCSKADWQAVNDNQDASTGTLHFLTCGRPDLEAALEKLKKEAHLLSVEGQKAKCYSCGVGGYQFHEQLQTTLNIEIENVSEGDCMMVGLQKMLKECTMSELVYPKMKEAEEIVKEEMKELLSVMTKVQEKSATKISMGTDMSQVDEQTDEKNDDGTKSICDVLGEDNLYPMLLMSLGSAYAYMKIDNISAPSILEISSRGGRNFMGMASLLTGCKSYDELIDMAEKGVNTRLDQTISSLTAKSEEATDKDDPYAVVGELKNDPIIFNFGHAVFKDRESFKKEDIARAWLICHVYDVCTTVYKLARFNRIQNLFVAGSFANRELVRKVMTQEFTRACIYGMIYQGPPELAPELRFMRFGGHSGALGALINSVEKFTIDRDVAAQAKASEESKSKYEDVDELYSTVDISAKKKAAEVDKNKNEKAEEQMNESLVTHF